MGSKLYKRGDTYWGYYSPKAGEYVRVSLRTKDRQVARARLRNLELGGRDVEADRSADQAKVPLRNALKAFTDSVKNDETREFYTQRGRHLERILGPALNLSGLTTEEVEVYVDTREGEGASTNTVYKEMVTLRNVLKAAKLDYKLVPSYKAGYVPRKRYITKEAYAAIAARLDPGRRDWLAVACFTGMRDSEIEAARPEWLDWNLGVINVGGTKTEGSRRVVPMADEVKAVLKRLPVEPWDNVRRDLSRAARAAGVIGDKEWLTPNDLRRTFASWLIQAGVPPFVVARLLGHKSTRMVELVYGQLDLATLRNAVARI